MRTGGGLLSIRNHVLVEVNLGGNGQGQFQVIGIGVVEREIRMPAKRRRATAQTRVQRSKREVKSLISECIGSSQRKPKRITWHIARIIIPHAKLGVVRVGLLLHHPKRFVLHKAVEGIVAPGFVQGQGIGLTVETVHTLKNPARKRIQQGAGVGLVGHESLSRISRIDHFIAIFALPQHQLPQHTPKSR